MAYRQILAGSTSQLIDFPVFDSSSTTGALLTGLVYNSGSLTAYYSRGGVTGAATSMSLVTMTKGTWTSLGFIAVDSTNMPGVYQLGIPDAALAVNAPYVTIVLKGATNMVPVTLVIELTTSVAQTGDSYAVVKSGGTGDAAAIKTQTDKMAFTVANKIDANTLAVGGTSQTARDLGASVLISAGTGTGQLDVTSGVIKANLAQILGTALTETAGYLAAGFKQFFNIASPTSTMNTITTVTTATNLTNAPSAGDLTSTMKTSVAAAAWGTARASYTSAGTFGEGVASVQGNVTGTVATVTNLTNAPTNGDLTATMKASVTTAASSSTPSVTVSDKTGFALTAGEHTNIGTDCYGALNTAYTDATSLNANSLLDRLRVLGWIQRNKIAVTDANGNTVIYKDDNSTAAFTVSAMLTDDSTTTTRLRAA